MRICPYVLLFFFLCLFSISLLGGSCGLFASNEEEALVAPAGLCRKHLVTWSNPFQCQHGSSWLCLFLYPSCTVAVPVSITQDLARSEGTAQWLSGGALHNGSG